MSINLRLELQKISQFFFQNYTLLLKVKLMFYKCILLPEGKKNKKTKKKTSVQKAESKTTDAEV